MKNEIIVSSALLKLRHRWYIFIIIIIYLNTVARYYQITDPFPTCTVQ